MQFGPSTVPCIEFPARGGALRLTMTYKGGSLIQ